MVENDAVIKLIKNADLYDPDYQGKKDILLSTDKIIKIADKIAVPTSQFYQVKVVEAAGMKVVPGFIDAHVHIIGGGGEGGFKTRTPEIQLSTLTKAGITTVVGVLGTDGTTRHISSLLAKARGLEEEGLTAYIYTGSYQFPLQTITSSVRDDIILIDKIIGVGEIALADHRSSQPDLKEFKKTAAYARTGGLLSGKAGIVHIHMGDGDIGLSYLLEIAEKTEIPIGQFLPTHINRNPEILQTVLPYTKKGGRIDLTTSSVVNSPEDEGIIASKAVKFLLDNDVSPELINFSSDGMGSLPQFNEKGIFTGLGIGSVVSLYQEIKKAVKEENIPLEVALKFITTNPAETLKLDNKGCIKKGHDADIVFLDKEMNIDTVIAGGKMMVTRGEIIKKGTFER